MGEAMPIFPILKVRARVPEKQGLKRDYDL